MVSFQPTFKLMLVSLTLILLLGLVPSSALANGLHINHDAASHADSAMRRHAARAGRRSKRFPPALDSNADAQELDRRERHPRTHGNHGLTPAEIQQLLIDEEIQDSSIYVTPANATNSTTTRAHTRHRTRTGTYSHEPTSTFLHPFAASSSNGTAASNTTSSALPTSSPTTHAHRYTPVHNSTSSSQSSDVMGPSSHNHTSSSNPTSSTSQSEEGSTSDTSSSSSVSDSTGNSTDTTSSNDDNNVVGGLLSPLLSPSTSSSSLAAQQTTNSQTQQSTSGVSSSSPSSADSSPSNNNESNNRTVSSLASQQSKTSQPDFFSFTPQAMRSSTQSAPSSTASGLVQGLLPVLGSSSSSSGSLPSSASPTPSPPNSSSSSSSDPDLTDAPWNQGSGSTGNSASTNGTATSTGSSTGGSSTSTGPSSTVTTGPTSTSLTNGPTTTGSVTGGGSGTDGGSVSGSSTGQQTLSASTSAVTSQPTLSSSNDSGSSYSSSSPSSSSDSSSSTATTNPYWYANTKSLNLAPSSSSSSSQPAETGSQSSASTSSTDSDTSTPSTSTAGSDTGGSAPLQDLPTTIVPSADSYNQPPNTTSIALLFKQDMQWSWVISQADLTAQIFAFMPDLVSQAVSLESSKVSTVKLASYTPGTPDKVNAVVHDVAANSVATARTLYMAYVPTSSVEDIQAMISNSSSPFYTSAAPGAPQQLASQVDPTFNILSVAGQVAAGTKQNATSGSGTSKDDSTLRNSLIGVGCGLAGIFAVVGGGLMWRKQRKDKEEPAGGNTGGISRAHTIRSFSGGLRETWAPDALDQHRALNTTGEMQQVWSPHDGGVAIGHPTAAMQSHGDGFGGYVASDPFQDSAAGGAGTGGYVNMNRSSRMTERSNYSDLSQMTEAQRIQYDYESSRHSFHSTSDHSGSHGSHSGHSNDSAGMLSTYQEEYRVPRQHTSNHAFGARSNSMNRSRRRGSVASSTIGRPEMMSNSVLL